MTSDDEIRAAHARLLKVFTKRPEAARSTNKATATVRDGLRCIFRQGGHEAIMDMPKIMGGDDAGPTPGFFGRAGLAGCVSIGLKQLAIVEGFNVDSVQVDIETEFDDGAAMGLGDNTAAPLETRLAIHVETDETEEKVRGLIDRLLEMDPWFLALRDAQSVSTDVMVRQRGHGR